MSDQSLTNPRYPGPWYFHKATTACPQCGYCPTCGRPAMEDGRGSWVGRAYWRLHYFPPGWTYDTCTASGGTSQGGTP